MSERVNLHPASYALYYAVLFFAHWFGAHRFDWDGDGDFDPEDVETYLADKGFIEKNFTQTATARRRARAKRRAEEARRKKEGTVVREDELGGDASPAQDPTTDGSPSPGSGDDRSRTASAFDRNSDGQIDIDDIIANHIGGGVAVEDTIKDNLWEKQILPWFIIVESIVCILFWAICAMVKATQDGLNPLQLKAGLDTLAPSMTDLRLSAGLCEDYRPQIWRWFTYQWTHVGAMHVLMNVFMVLMLGIPLEGLHGGLRMFFMFNVGVFGGACCYIVNDAHTAVVGCSGGVYALIGMHVADLIMNWQQKRFRLPTIVFLTILIGIDIFSYAMSIGGANSSHSAHVGGFIAGVVIGLLVGKNIILKAHEKGVMVCAFVFGAFLVIFCMVWLALNPAPLNIWEAIGGENGYCWIRQIYNAAIDETSWLCVRCGTQACIDEWNPQRATPVRVAVCDRIGYHFDGR